MVLKPKSTSGSTTVEAAIVLPVLFLIVALFISVAVRINENVGSVCAGLETETESRMNNDPMLTESSLRIRWLDSLGK